MKMKRLILLLTGLATFAAAAGTVQEQQQFIESLRDKSQSLREAPPALPETAAQGELSETDAAWLAQLQQRRQQESQASQPRTQSDALYLISFSVPEDGLKLMIPEAAGFGIPSVINGLIDNDFRKTAAAVFRLTKENEHSGVQIDPTAFDRFGIRQVPALVVRCGEQYDVVYGNLKIGSALEAVARDGECADTAKRLLNKENRDD